MIWAKPFYHRAQLLCPSYVIANERLQPSDPISANQKPKFQRPKLSPQRHSPFVEIHRLMCALGLQIAGAQTQGADLLGRVGDELYRAVELCTKPFMWIENNALDCVNPPPKRTKLGANHR